MGAMRPLRFLSRLFAYRGTSVITCPETDQPAAVKVDLLRSAFADLRLGDCSRWPEKAGCDQDCLRQLAAQPEACRLHTLVEAWYAGRSCLFCQRPIGRIAWHERPPALLGADGTTREWKDVAPEELPAMFRTSEPVCWACHVVLTFRREHPDLVTERPRPRPADEHFLYTTNVY